VDDPAQEVHDKQMASLSDGQRDGLAQAIKEFMEYQTPRQPPPGALSTLSKVSLSNPNSDSRSPFRGLLFWSIMSIAKAAESLGFLG
jgi:hypothetical protein